jgi:hypothetical protein
LLNNATALNNLVSKAANGMFVLLVCHVGQLMQFTAAFGQFLLLCRFVKAVARLLVKSAALYLCVFGALFRGS